MSINRLFKGILFLLVLMQSLAIEANAAALNLWCQLKKENKSFARSDKKKRQNLVYHGQHPCTIVLSCSDSRVPPELVFKQSLGDFFVVRVAGEVVDDVVVDSIEYAVTHFGPILILVLGHSQCGAVSGALDRLKKNNGQITPQPGHLDAVLQPIEMAILAAGIDLYAYNALELSVIANIEYVANQLLYQSNVIYSALANGTISIIGAEYNLMSGRVHTLFTWNNVPN